LQNAAKYPQYYDISEKFIQIKDSAETKIPISNIIELVESSPVQAMSLFSFKDKRIIAGAFKDVPDEDPIFGPKGEYLKELR
jgi:hypothetical protein